MVPKRLKILSHLLAIVSHSIVCSYARLLTQIFIILEEARQWRVNAPWENPHCEEVYVVDYSIRLGL